MSKSKCLNVKFDGLVKSQKLTNLSFPRKRESSNYTQLWIPDQVGNDKTAKTPTFYEAIKFIVYEILVLTVDIHLNFGHCRLSLLIP